MTWDIDRLLDEVGKAIGYTLEDLDSGKVLRMRKVTGDDIFKVTTSLSVGPLIPEDPGSESSAREPLVDIFDDKNGLKIVVELPGIKKEDVRVRFLDGMLRIDVYHKGKMHRKDVPWNTAPGTVEVWTTKENNSVVEITFAKRPGSEED